MFNILKKFWVRQYTEADEAGKINGKHFTEYVNDVKRLKRARKNQDVEELLLKLVEATEAQDKIDNLGVAPWYYAELAVLYRSQKNYSAEVEVLQRYFQHRRAEGKYPEVLANRLQKAQELYKRSLSK